MIVRFRKKALRQCYEQHKLALKTWNEKVARRYIQRINILQACDSVEDLHKLPQLRLHGLSGKRQKQHAIDIDGFWRLIVSFDETKREVYIEEVSKHYDN